MAPLLPLPASTLQEQVPSLQGQVSRATACPMIPAPASAFAFKSAGMTEGIPPPDLAGWMRPLSRVEG